MGQDAGRGPSDGGGGEDVVLWIDPVAVGGRTPLPPVPWPPRSAAERLAEERRRVAAERLGERAA